MDALIAQIQSLLSTADDVARRSALDALKNLQRTIETPPDTLQRLAGLGLELTAARIGVNLGLFRILAQSQEPQTVSFLSQATGAPSITLARILRHLSAEGMIRETARDTFAASAITHALANEDFAAGIIHFHDNVQPVFQAFPSFLEETKYADIIDPAQTPFQKAFDTPLPAFAWLPSQPARFGPLQQVMAAQQRGSTPWFTVFPFATSLGGFTSPTAPTLVDVGGGFGHQCLALLSAYPDLAGKLVLQDLPETLALVPPHPSISTQAHNFFTPQPASNNGAKFFYLRQILHDHPDDRCLAILGNLKQVMAPESEILIDEMVLTDEKVHWQATQIDLTMMASLGSRERTETEWRVLLGQAGLKIKSITRYIEPKGDAIIHCIL